MIYIILLIIFILLVYVLILYLINREKKYEKKIIQITTYVFIYWLFLFILYLIKQIIILHENENAIKLNKNYL